MHPDLYLIVYKQQERELEHQLEHQRSQAARARRRARKHSRLWPLGTWSQRRTSS